MATPSERGLQIKVGALILAAAALLVGFIVVLGAVSLGGGKRLEVDFGFSGNLQPGAPVKISGIKVGKVERVDFWGGKLDERTQRHVQVRVTAWIEDRAVPAVHSDAELSINTAGVLGEQYLEISPGKADRPLLDWSKAVEGLDPPRTDLIVSRLFQFLDAITTLLTEDKNVIRDFLSSGASLVKTLDQLLKDNHEQIARLLANVDRLSGEASTLIASVRSGVGDAGQLKRTLGNIEATSASIRRDIDPLLAKTRRALDGVDNLTSVVGPDEKRKLQKTLDEISRIGDKVDGVTTDAQAIVADVKRGKGTAGALLVDPQVYDDLKELVRDLKRNPWKFFWKK